MTRFNRQIITDIGTGEHLPGSLYELSSLISFLGGWSIINRNNCIIYLGLYDSENTLLGILSIPAATPVVDGIREQANNSVTQYKDVKSIKVSIALDFSDTTPFEYNLFIELLSI